MTRYVIDTNVPIVANGKSEEDEGRRPSLECREASIKILQLILDRGKILLDQKGDIQAEYRKHLNPAGQPGVGDRFYLEVLNSNPKKIQRIDIKTDEHGEYIDLPSEIKDCGFDNSDRKFAALSFKEKVPVINATDSDWWEHKNVLKKHGLEINFICGCCPDKWYET